MTIGIASLLDGLIARRALTWRGLGGSAANTPHPVLMLHETGDLEHRQRAQYAGRGQARGNGDLVRGPGRTGRQSLVDEPFGIREGIEGISGTR